MRVSQVQHGQRVVATRIFSLPFDFSFMFWREISAATRVPIRLLSPSWKFFRPPLASPANEHPALRVKHFLSWIFCRVNEQVVPVDG